jgi:hypothetical protein
VPGASDQSVGEFDHPCFVTEYGSGVTSRDHGRVAVNEDSEGETDAGDTELDDVALQEVFPDDRKAFRGGKDRTGVVLLENLPDQPGYELRPAASSNVRHS